MCVIYIFFKIQHYHPFHNYKMKVCEDSLQSTEITESPPHIVFIIPYRNREPQKFFFENYMTYLMEDYEEGKNYLIYFVEQNDSRPFNRGAMKNIGFIAIRNIYPKSYKNIIFIFNDIDAVPYKKHLLDFSKTKDGVISHHYGFKFALGGIVSITGNDYERINGFANYWSWGFEDNLLQNRAQRAGISIDRSNFFEINDMRILHINDGNKKTLNRKYMYELVLDKGDNGINTISNLDYQINEETRTINVSCFDVEYSPWLGKFEQYDLRNGRDLQAPISKEMMLENAKNGNNLETLYFIDENGVKKKPTQMLREEISTNTANNAKPNLIQNSKKSIMINANNLRQLQRDNAKPKITTQSSPFIMSRGYSNPLVMSGVKRVERINAHNIQEQLKERQRNQQRMMYGRIGLSR